MSFHPHQAGYDHATTRQQELITEAELFRQLEEAARPRPGLVARLLLAAGRALVAAGERMASPATLGSRL